MQFASDNWAGAHPKIVQGLIELTEGFAPAYGGSSLDQAVVVRFNEIFEREVQVFFVGTGTCANALALAAVNRPGGVVFCHREAHLVEDECGATEYLTGGARLYQVAGRLGRIDLGNLARAVDRHAAAHIRHGQPMAVSLTQATEIGTVYRPEQIALLGAFCHEHALPLHMDGARFANALITLGLTPAQMTWKQGVDIVSFGATKNGCWCAEALIFMDPAMATQTAFLRKRAAQHFSKSRFISAQFMAYFENDLWLQLARHANATASRLAEAIRDSKSIRLAWQPEANEVFAVMRRSTAEWLKSRGADFYSWRLPHLHTESIGEDEDLFRFVTNFSTTNEEVERFCALI